MNIRKFLFRWLFVIWFIVATAVYVVAEGKGFEEGGFFILSVITFILYFPAIALGELYWLLSKLAPASLYISGGLFALSLDLLRLHIKKYREYKRIAKQVRE
jgi:phosphotransferase system  glucose/maltose/N-acetylglucosamine-specific IIC component